MRRPSLIIVFAFLLVAAGAGLMGQTGVEYGATTAASTAGAAAGGKEMSKSLGRVFRSVDKTLNKASGTGKQSTASRTESRSGRSRSKDQTVTEIPVAKSARSAAKPKALRIARPSQIRIGMSREELLSALGEPFMTVDGTDEAGPAETYMYQGEAGTLTVTLHGGKVTKASPVPEESAAAPPPAYQPPGPGKTERPQ